MGLTLDSVARVVSRFLAVGFVLAGMGRVHATLQVDFDDNDAGIVTQPGFTSATQAGGPIAAPFGQGGSISLSFASDGSIDDRDRGAMNVAQPLGDVGRDFIFGNRNAGATRLDVVLADLAAGNYTFTGYYHDNNGSSPFDIDIDANTGSGFADATTVARSFGTNPAGGIASTTFGFDANGVNSVVLRHVAETNGHLINGFELAANPLPALNVDIGLNNHDVQPGFFSFERGSAAGADDETQRFLTDFGNDGTVDVTLTNANVFRDRATSGNPVGGAFGDLAESFFAHQDELTLTLSNLVAGDYRITTYHHDSQTDHDIIGVRITDADRDMADLGLSLDPTTGTSPLSIATFDLLFRSDGINDVQLQFFEQTAPGSIILNGFTLERIDTVPEPATAILALLGGGMLLARRRRACRTE